MDSLTQAALGAAIGEALLGKKLGHKAALAGAVIATIPDLDVLLLPLYNDLDRISIHRGYSHSILFTVLGAFLFAYILNRIKWTKTASYWKLWLFSFLALFTHVLLDTFTSYGTQLFLPITDWRVSFDSISIVDPVYTLPLLIGLIVSLFIYKKKHKRRNLPNTLGLIISSVYLLFTLANKQHIQNVMYDQLESQGISHYRLLTVPVAIGNTAWYGVAKDDKQLHIGRYSLLEKNPIDFESFDINDQLLEELDPYLVDRLKWFAQGFYTVAEYEGKIRLYNMQCDMQGVRSFGDYKAPTAFYYEIEPLESGEFRLDSGMHSSDVADE
ncbi:MAG: metal-dependent hydrolase [Bacteroidia bacterium]|nr:metal-dependent hydrolase [Bacteroidia bacterium]